MKVKSFTTLPKYGDFTTHQIWFTQDDMNVIKDICISGCMNKITAARPYEMQRQVMRAVVAAERDMAFAMFGDKWREHVRPMGCPDHVRLACDAADMRPDLFPTWSATNAHQ